MASERVMSQEFESDFEDIGCTHNGKRYKVGFRPFFEDNSNSTREQSHNHRERIERGYSLPPLYSTESTRGSD